MAPEVTVEDIELKRLDAVATLDTKHVNEMKRLDQEDLLESSNVCITNSTARCTVLTNLMAQHVPDGPGPQGATSSTCSREHRHLVPPRVRDHHTRVREHHPRSTIRISSVQSPFILARATSVKTKPL